MSKEGENNMDEEHQKSKLLHSIRTEKRGDISEILSLFDELEPTDVEFLIGRWKGFEIATGHKLDSMLNHAGWYGKIFKSKEEVYPLVFFNKSKSTLFAVNPKYLSFDIKVPKTKILNTIVGFIKPFIQTKSSSAKIKMIEYRGKVTSTMAYDDKPINDHFVKIDKNTVLGIMDKKGEKSPYAFILERDDSSNYKMEFEI